MERIVSGEYYRSKIFEVRTGCWAVIAKAHFKVRVRGWCCDVISANEIF